MWYSQIALVCLILGFSFHVLYIKKTYVGEKFSHISILWIVLLVYHSVLSLVGYELHQTVYAQSDVPSYLSDANAVIDFLGNLLSADASSFEDWPVLHNGSSPRALAATGLFIPFIFFFGTGPMAWIAVSCVVLWCVWQASIVLSITYRVPLVVPLVALAGIPSMAIWQCGLYKESLLAGCMAMFYVTSWRILSGSVQRPRQFWLVFAWVLLFGIVWLLKFYIAFFFIPAVVFTLIPERSYTKRTLQIAALTLVGLIFTIYIGKAMPAFADLPLAIRLNHANTLLQSANGSVYHFPASPESTYFFYHNILHAVWLGLFGPPFAQAQGWIYTYVAAERLLVSCMVLVVLVFTTVKGTIQFGAPKVWVWVFYVFFSAVGIALSTPNMGALSRYQSMYLPVLVFMAFCAAYQPKVGRHLT